MKNQTIKNNKLFIALISAVAVCVLALSLSVAMMQSQANASEVNTKALSSQTTVNKTNKDDRTIQFTAGLFSTTVGKIAYVEYENGEETWRSEDENWVGSWDKDVSFKLEASSKTNDTVANMLTLTWSETGENATVNYKVELSPKIGEEKRVSSVFWTDPDGEIINTGYSKTFDLKSGDNLHYILTFIGNDIHSAYAGPVQASAIDYFKLDYVTHDNQTGKEQVKSINEAEIFKEIFGEKPTELELLGLLDKSIIAFRNYIVGADGKLRIEVHTEEQPESVTYYLEATAVPKAGYAFDGWVLDDTKLVRGKLGVTPEPKKRTLEDYGITYYGYELLANFTLSKGAFNVDTSTTEGHKGFKVTTTVDGKSTVTTVDKLNLQKADSKISFIDKFTITQDGKLVFDYYSSDETNADTAVLVNAVVEPVAADGYNFKNFTLNTKDIVAGEYELSELKDVNINAVYDKIVTPTPTPVVDDQTTNSTVTTGDYLWIIVLVVAGFAAVAAGSVVIAKKRK